MRKPHQTPSFVLKMFRRITTALLALTVGVGAVLVAARAAQAQTYTVLYAFQGGSDGAFPYASLLRDKSGNLYGTTSKEGSFQGGTVFKVDTSGTETVLHSFSGPDGSNPYAGLIRDAVGNLYGTTYYGGVYGYGTVFKLDTHQNETVLYSFTGGRDGSNPAAPVLLDAAGNLYGTTEYGGAFSFRCFSGCGVVFKLSVQGKETVLHKFTGKPDGAFPSAGLLRDAAGNLYGTTTAGGNYDAGTVFKIAKRGTETLIHVFESDGASPYAGLIGDGKGNLYGTTSQGGSSLHGTIFKLDKAGQETVLFNFNGTNGGESVAGLVRDPAGNLYGTTLQGGSTNWGTIFELDKTGHETILHSFTYREGGSDAALIRDSRGNLYGTTGNCSNCNFGTVFRLTP